MRLPSAVPAKRPALRRGGRRWPGTGRGVRLDVGVVLEAAVEEVAEQVERILGMPPAAQGGLLNSPAGPAQHLPAELDGVERLGAGVATARCSR